jgi:hypothetical protein
MYYCTRKVLKSQAKSAQADLLYSSLLLKLTACLLYSFSLPLHSCLRASAATTHSYLVTALNELCHLLI